MDLVHTVAVPLSLGGVLAVFFVIWRVTYWQNLGDLVLNPGYLPPLPKLPARMLRTVLGYLFVFLFIGRLRIIGRKRLKYCGRLIALGNHQTERDAILMPYLLGLRHSRYFIAKNQAGGWRAPLVAYTGGIVVEHASRRGPVAALRLAIDSMKKEGNTDFVIFPQGRLVRDNTLRREDFFAGVAVLGSKVAPESSKTVAYLPVGIFYDRDPKNRTLFHKLMNMIGFRSFRGFFGEVIYGATVVVGEPIPVSCLPENADKATDELFESVVALSARAATVR